MERLTKRSKEGLPVIVRGRALGPAFFSDERDYKDYADALERLAEYEDTGLTPEEYSFNKEQLRVLNLFMEQIADAEEAVRRAEACRDDRLVILPCKVGDMVYYRRGSYIIGDDVKRIVLDGIDNQVIIDHNHSFMFSDFGRKVWSCRAEAEAALRGESNDHL